MLISFTYKFLDSFTLLPKILPFFFSLCFHSDTYWFVLTNFDGARVYGYCRRIWVSILNCYAFNKKGRELMGKKVN